MSRGDRREPVFLEDAGLAQGLEKCSPVGTV
jgi:hypothetical protein